MRVAEAQHCRASLGHHEFIISVDSAARFAQMVENPFVEQADRHAQVVVNNRDISLSPIKTARSTEP